MAKDNLVPVSGICLTEKQKRALAGGKAVRLKHAHLSGGSITLHVGPVQARRIVAASRKGKGVQVGLNQKEFKATTGGSAAGDWFKKIGHKIKEPFKPHGAAEKFGKKVTKAVVKKVTRAAMNAAASAAAVAAAAATGETAAPVLVPAAVYGANKAADRFDQELDRKWLKGWGSSPQIRPSRLGVVKGHIIPSCGGSLFLGPDHPAMNPPDSRIPGNDMVKRGGSFKPAGGYGLRGSGFGFPDSPGVGHPDLPSRM